MALSQDQINILVSVSTSAAQQNLSKLSSQIKSLTDLNKDSKKELKATEAELKSLSKSLEKCAATAGTNSQEYAKLVEQYDKCVIKLGSLNKSIKDNDAAIASNKEGYKGMLMGMKDSELTMNQLKEKTRMLQSQLNNTSAAANPKLYKELQQQLNSTSSAMQGLKVQGQGVMGFLTHLPGPVGAAASSVQGFGTSLKAVFTSGPLAIAAAVILAVVAAFKLLKAGLASNEEAGNKLKQAFAPFKALFQGLVKVIGDVINVIASGVLWIEKMGAALVSVILPFSNVNKKNEEAIDLEKRKQKVMQEERQQVVSNAKTEMEVSGLRAKAADKEHYTAQQRLSFIKEANDLEKRQLATNLAIAKEKLSIAKIEALRSGNSAESAEKIAQLEAAYYDAQKAYNDKLTSNNQSVSKINNEIRSDQKEAAAKFLEQQKKNLEILTKKIEEEHKKRVTILQAANAQDLGLEADKQLRILSEEKRYHELRLVAYTQFLKQVKDKSLRSEIKENIATENQAILDNQRSTDEQRIAAVQEQSNKYLDVLQESYDQEKTRLQEKLNTGIIKQEAYDNAILVLDNTLAQNRLNVYSTLSANLNQLNLKNKDLQVKAVKEAGKESVAAAQAATVSETQLIKKAKEDEKDFILSNATLTAEQQMEIEIASLTAIYDARKAELEAEHMNTLALTEAFEQAKQNIILKYENDTYSLRQQLGLTNWQQDYDNQLKNLKALLDTKQISEDEYDTAVFNSKVGKIKKYFDYYSGLASQVVQSMQDAEISAVDKKYDVLIKAAGDDSEKTEQLEKEKEKKKLAIQKKYADVNFAIKASQIVADTAVAIMTALGQLGPIAGAIAAAAIGVTGAMQLVQANNERQKVKNMTLDGTTSSSSSSVQTRVVTGAEEGGYQDYYEEVERAQDGRKFWAKRRGSDRGYMSSPTLLVGENGQEFVANAATVSNPTIRPWLDVINDAQKGGYSGQLNMNTVRPAVAMAAGGYTSTSSGTSRGTGAASSTIVNNLLASSPDDELLQKLYALLSKMDKDGIKAWIVLSELQKKQDLMKESDSYSTNQ